MRPVPRRVFPARQLQGRDHPARGAGHGPQVSDDKRAALRFECRDKIGHPISRKDFCDDHAKPIIANAKAIRIEVFRWKEADVT